MSPMLRSSRAWKTTISSIRLMNSGRKCPRTSAITASFTTAGSSLSMAWILCEPRFEVITMTVFLKSTVRPCPSVMRPSSSACSSTLNTSGCAFSISSSRITL